ncbi:hypothetical protein XM38_007880 [Halomicronema hongdechloris C2206]|uniref:Uncharacterized protein n=1 Tax=Halomicronema hongdechloris C2206 TaxID=1641165 RepID=A0A1Z3HHV5_9CYAN|nr:hypothetical protein [Halomicronema hongdechloris]ASC69858.1 hypothetical protein XM38_007880 [Halomicronema hongdechloris C2206]
MLTSGDVTIRQELSQVGIGGVTQFPLPEITLPNAWPFFGKTDLPLRVDETL